MYQMLFEQHKDYRKQRLANYAIDGHVATIQLGVVLTCKQAGVINRALLHQRTGMRNKIGSKLLKSFDDIIGLSCQACKDSGGPAVPTEDRPGTSHSIDPHEQPKAGPAEENPWKSKENYSASSKMTCQRKSTLVTNVHFCDH